MPLQPSWLHDCLVGCRVQLERAQQAAVNGGSQAGPGEAAAAAATPAVEEEAAEVQFRSGHCLCRACAVKQPWCLYLNLLSCIV